MSFDKVYSALVTHMISLCSHFVGFKFDHCIFYTFVCLLGNELVNEDLIILLLYFYIAGFLRSHLKGWKGNGGFNNPI